MMEPAGSICACMGTCSSFFSFQEIFLVWGWERIDWLIFHHPSIMSIVNTGLDGIRPNTKNV